MIKAILYKRPKFSKLLLVSTFLLFLIHKFNEVSVELTQEDRFYASKIMNEKVRRVQYSFLEQEISIIKNVQTSVLALAPTNKGIPHKQEREPKDLYQLRKGLCYDRSRVIEKILMAYGFHVRHISIFKKDNKLIPSYLRGGTESHAFSEVLTSSGWMLVDSNAKFIGLTENNDVISVKELHDNGFHNYLWVEYNSKTYQPLYSKRFYYIYGLYSRHGKFYPPYSFIPDYNLGDLVSNFL